MTQKSNQFYHLIAFGTAIIWGTTLVSTKVLLRHDLSPVEIMLYRFVVAYVVLRILHPKSYAFGGWRDELIFLGTGLCGGTIYFLTENTALGITLASNVALIVTTAPILTAIFAHLMVKNERLHRNLMIGSITALAGVALVVFNGQFILRLNPLGDFLSIVAAASWALYSVLLKKLDHKYHTLYITRKVFFYGIITLLPYLLIDPIHFDWQKIIHPEVVWNLLFLGIIASSGCFILWNIAIKHLGSVRTNNYIYFIPIVTLLTSVWILDERITLFAVIGTFLILSGVYFVENGLSIFSKAKSLDV